MRVSTALFYQNNLNTLQNGMRDLADTQQEIATGRRILKPSDDPVATAQLMDLNESIARTEQFQRNADQANQKLSLKESALAGAEEIAFTIRDVAIQSNNGAQDDTSRQALLERMENLRGNLMQLANKEGPNGDYLFAGDAGDQQPFAADGTYSGGTNAVDVRISDERRVTVAEPGSRVFGDDTGGLIKAVDDVIADLAAGNPAGAAGVDALDAGLDQLSEARSRLGTRLEAVEEQQDYNAEQLTESRIARSKIEDTDLAQAITDLTRQQTSLQAAQQSFVKIQGMSLFNYIS